MAKDYSALAPYESYIQEAAKKHGVTPDEIRAIIMQESSGKADASNPNSSALGLMQLTNAHGLTREQRLDPKTNIDAGTAYYAANKKAFNGDIQKALVGYHEGTAGARAIFNGKRSISEEGKNYVNSPNFTPLYANQNQPNIGNPVANLPTAPKPLQGNELLEAPANTPTQANVNASQGALMGTDVTTEQGKETAAQEQARIAQEQEENRKRLQEERDRKFQQQQSARDALFSETAAGLEGLIAGLGKNTDTESHTQLTNFYRPQWGAPTDQALNTISGFGTMRNMLGQ